MELVNAGVTVSPPHCVQSVDAKAERKQVQEIMWQHFALTHDDKKAPCKICEREFVYCINCTVLTHKYY